MSFIPWPIWGSHPKMSNKIQYGHHSGEILDERDGYFVVACKTCILNHVLPLPSEAFLADYYATHFYQVSKADYVERYERDREWWELHHQYTVNQALRHLRGSTAHADEDDWEYPLYVLDVGAGPGIFLDVAKRSGFVTFGIELNKQVAELSRSRGHAVWVGTLQDYRYSRHEPLFHMVHLYEVLEHVPDPEEFLYQCRDLLDHGGVLHVVVPNDYSPLQLLAQERCNLPRWWLAPPEHLNYFEPKSLQLMVRRVGFRIVDIRGTFPMEKFLLNGDIYVGDDELGRKCHTERMRYEMEAHRNGQFESLMDEYRENMSDPYSGTIGREICLTAIKE
ncbi:MAG TPA: class I SAM-dependent methyltransferase [Alphaproteobacteria bacterium]|nr:class I SAM-dependent methyltransferase [Alphaproteobacteria bacterium]